MNFIKYLIEARYAEESHPLIKDIKDAIANEESDEFSVVDDDVSTMGSSLIKEFGQPDNTLEETNRYGKLYWTIGEHTDLSYIFKLKTTGRKRGVVHVKTIQSDEQEDEMWNNAF